MRNSTELVVDGAKYRTTKYPASTGLELFERLLKSGGKSLIMLYASMQTEATPETMGNIVDALIAGLNRENSLVLIKELLEGCEIRDGESWRPVVPSFDVDFAGKIFHLFKLVKEIIAFQFGDFPEGLVAMGGALDKTAPTSKVKAKKAE